MIDRWWENCKTMWIETNPKRTQIRIKTQPTKRRTSSSTPKSAWWKLASFLVTEETLFSISPPPSYHMSKFSSPHMVSWNLYVHLLCKIMYMYYKWTYSRVLQNLFIPFFISFQVVIAYFIRLRHFPTNKQNHKKYIAAAVSSAWQQQQQQQQQWRQENK